MVLVSFWILWGVAGKFRIAVYGWMPGSKKYVNLYISFIKFPFIYTTDFPIAPRDIMPRALRIFNLNFNLYYEVLSSKANPETAHILA